MTKWTGAIAVFSKRYVTPFGLGIASAFNLVPGPISAVSVPDALKSDAERLGLDSARTRADLAAAISKLLDEHENPSHDDAPTQGRA